MACIFQATIDGKFAPLIGLSDEDMDMDTMITTYNTASEILGKERRRKKPWVIKDFLDLCDERRGLKKKRYEAEGAKEYREANRRIQKAVKKAKNRLGSEPEEAPQNRSSTVESCVKSTSNISRICIMYSLTSKKPLTEYGMQPYGPPCGSTISMQIEFAPLSSSMTRLQVQSR